MRLEWLRGMDIFGQGRFGSEPLTGAWSKTGFLNRGTINILGQMVVLLGAVLCLLGCLEGSLAFTYLMPKVLREAKMSLEVAKFPWGWGVETEAPPVENH